MTPVCAREVCVARRRAAGAAAAVWAWRAEREEPRLRFSRNRLASGSLCLQFVMGRRPACAPPSGAPPLGPCNLGHVACACACNVSCLRGPGGRPPRFARPPPPATGPPRCLFPALPSLSAFDSRCKKQRQPALRPESRLRIDVCVLRLERKTHRWERGTFWRGRRFMPARPRGCLTAPAAIGTAVSVLCSYLCHQNKLFAPHTPAACLLSILASLLYTV